MRGKPLDRGSPSHPRGESEVPFKSPLRVSACLRMATWLGLAAVLAGSCAGGTDVTGARDNPPPTFPTSPVPSPSASPSPGEDASTPRFTPDPDPSPSPEPTQVSDPALPEARNWRVWPEIPALDTAARAILEAGLELGLDPHAFSVVGDCQSMPNVFLGIYDRPGRYWLPDAYSSLQETIVFFHSSFSRQNVTVRNGISAASVLSPLWAEPGMCNSSETPLDCELRRTHPAVLLINLGMNWPEGNVPRHTDLVRQVVQTTLEQGVLPVLSTQGDAAGEGAAINEGIAQVALDLDVPLWNAWRAIQHLPNHGLDLHRGTGYLTVDAWDARSFSALRTLQAIQAQLVQISPPGQEPVRATPVLDSGS